MRVETIHIPLPALHMKKWGRRGTGKVPEGSIAGQIEFWAPLGRAVEPLLHGTPVMALRKAGTH